MTYVASSEDGSHELLRGHPLREPARHTQRGDRQDDPARERGAPSLAAITEDPGAVGKEDLHGQREEVRLATMARTTSARNTSLVGSITLTCKHVHATDESGNRSPV